MICAPLLDSSFPRSAWERTAQPLCGADQAARYRGKPAPRINRPERFQGEWRAESLDERLDPDHPVRLVWAYIEGLDFSEVFERIKAVAAVAAVAGVAGRNASDDRVLFALLLWATIDGVDSACEIARLSVTPLAHVVRQRAWRF